MAGRLEWILVGCLGLLPVGALAQEERLSAPSPADWSYRGGFHVFLSGGPLLDDPAKTVDFGAGLAYSVSPQIALFAAADHGHPVRSARICSSSYCYEMPGLVTSTARVGVKLSLRSSASVSPYITFAYGGAQIHRGFAPWSVWPFNGYGLFGGAGLELRRQRRVRLFIDSDLGLVSSSDGDDGGGFSPWPIRFGVSVGL